MRRQEFMIRLRELLADLPDADKEDALRFYNEYFDDAGPENEETVLIELVSPETISRMLHEEIGTKQYPIPMKLLGGGSARDGEYREYSGSSEGTKAGDAARFFEEGINDVKQQWEGMDRSTRNTRIALLILLVLIVAVCAPFVGSVFGVLVAVLIAPLALVIACGTGSVAVAIVALIVCINAMMKISVSFGGGMTLLGISFLLLSLACLLLLGTRGFKKILHWYIDGIKALVGWIKNTWAGRQKR